MPSILYNMLCKLQAKLARITRSKIKVKLVRTIPVLNLKKKKTGFNIAKHIRIMDDMWV